MKSNYLRAMYKAALNVPPFTTYAYGNLLPNRSEINALLALHERVPIQISELSRQLQAAVKRAYREIDIPHLGSTTFAVRSSSSIEDGLTHSFAGIFDSFLNVEPASLNDACIDCLVSLFSERALAYYAHHTINPANLTMDVIVQQMVHSDRAGILFSANPLGVLSESVIVVGRGLGNAVVDDQVPCTTYYYGLFDDTYSYQGIEDLLSEQAISQLIALGKRIKALLKFKHVDIEFAMTGDEIHILQARPITTLMSNTPAVLDNSNIVESYPGLSLPLTASFASEIYSGVFRGVATRILKNERLLNTHADMLDQMVHCYNGRMYYRIDHWYAVLNFLPFRKKTTAVWQDMLGVKHGTTQMRKHNFAPHRVAYQYLNFFVELYRVPRNMKQLNTKFANIYKNYCLKDLHQLDNSALRALYLDLKRQLLDGWDITLINDMYAFLFTGLLKARLKKKYPEQCEQHVLDFISNITQIDSLKPMHALLLLVDTYANDPQSDNYQRAKNNYIEQYGDRTLEELKLETATYRTSPERLDSLVASYAEDGDKLSALRANLSQSVAIDNHLHGRLTRFLAHRATLGIQNRETSRLNRTRIFGMVRTIFLCIGNNLQRQGHIDHTRDIFYLTIEQVFACIDRPQRMQAIVDERKMTYQNYAHWPAYSRWLLSDINVNTSYPALHQRVSTRQAHLLSGTPCATGIVHAQVIVADHALRVEDVKGKIIVAPMTDPGWVFILAAAKGIIVEKGSLLSHTAIISRELGIVAVVGVSDATKLIKTGDTVTLDGNKGTVQIEKRLS